MGGVDPEDDLTGIPKEGDIIATKFTVERVLGAGGMGVVVAARHIQLGQRVAVKFLRPAAAKNKEAIGRFLREARSVVSLQSAHVVRVSDVGTLETGLPYMVMEHLTGDDLSTVLHARGPLPVGEAVDYVLQACEAIAEAHSLGIVHRDLKPPNLFLTKKPDGSALVKVLDFGISKAVDGAAMMDQSLTATSSIMGSPIYMSPEQLRSSKNVDSRTDIWALGVILFELVAGAPPFEDETMTGLCAKIVADRPPLLRERRRDAPLEFEGVVARCLDKDVTRRFQTVGELAMALKPFAASMDGRMSADRAARIGTPFRPPQASVPIVPPASTRDVNVHSATSLAEMPGHRPAGLAESVSTWQTAGVPNRRTRAVAIIGVVCGLGAIAAAVAFVVMRGDSPSPAASSPASTAPAPPSSTVASAVPSAPASTSSAAALAPLFPSPSASASATASAKTAGRALPLNVRPPAGSAPAKPPAPPSTAGLLDDRK
jgi:serine/threonine-protein kinase